MAKKVTSSGDAVRDGTETKASKCCENHGGCPYCEGNRLYARHKSEAEAEDKLNEDGS